MTQPRARYEQRRWFDVDAVLADLLDGLAAEQRRIVITAVADNVLES